MKSTSATRSAEAVQQEQIESELRELRAQLEARAVEIEKFKTLAGTDALTDVANRRAFDQEVERRQAELNRHNHRFCLLLLDVDGFKAINDQHGHLIGDDVLQVIAKALSEHIRTSDSVFRIGGDEFAVVLPATDLTQAKLAVERIFRAVKPALEETKSQLGLCLSLSVGVAEAQVNEPLRQLIHRADQSMYAAKKQPGNSYDAGESLGVSSGC